MGNRIYVGNFAFSTTEGDLLELFKQSGQVVRCDLVLDKFTGKARGFAFVEMGSQDEANKAINELNKKPFQGRTLVVNEARPREDRPPRGDDGGPGGGGGRPPRHREQREGTRD